MPLRITFNPKRVVLSLGHATLAKAAICLLLTVVGALAPLPESAGNAPRIALILFAASASLWITELVPPFATALMLIVTAVYLLGHPQSESAHDDWLKYLNPIASPPLVLFFGGFILAIAGAKHGFDLRVARALITPFGQEPKRLLLGIILTTALFSMFMSNTATTAMMMAILAPIFGQLADRPATRKMFVLAVPFAANIGGMGTIIGSPPNAVAASLLHRLDGGAHAISFVQWMMIATPIVAVLLVLLWGLLVAAFRPGRTPLAVSFPEVVEVTPGMLVVGLVFLGTITLWLTQPLHGLPAAVVALVPIGLFPMLGILDGNDLRRVDWDVLILVAGGLTLGVVMTETGLSKIVVDAIPFGGLSAGWIIATVALLSVVLSNFMSNTSASNILLPIVTSLGVLSPRVGALAVALACSLAMSLPISTPPNAIAFATRAVTTYDIARFGSIISVLGLAVVLTAVLVFAR